jgi:ATP-dependent DNA helicase PIF1
MDLTTTQVNQWKLQFDGGSRGNPGVGGAGAVLYKNNQEQWSKTFYLGDNVTNNQAEYKGLIGGLKHVSTLDLPNLLVEGDSNLVINQVSGTWRVKNDELKILHDEVQEYINKIKDIRFQHIPRNENKRADQLANEAMDRKQDMNNIMSSLVNNETKIERKPQFTDNIQFTTSQQKAIDKFINKENIFITGPGGSGKSAVIRKIVEHADKTGIRYQVCGLTGCASVLLKCGAKTLHSWSGIGLGKGAIEIVSHKVAANKYKRNNWRNVDLLIIDEVSMMSEHLIELLDMTAKKCRKNNRLFGGLQVIFSGDFYQLAPVGDRDDESKRTHNFCFESPIFNELFPNDNKICFDEIFRQTDNTYTKILNQIRVGKISKKSIKILSERVGKKHKDTDIKPTRIYPLKKLVNKLNTTSMAKLTSSERKFKIEAAPIPDMSSFRELNITPDQIKTEIEYLKNNVSCDKTLVLKKGAQVMCVVNLDVDGSSASICNGSQGVVEDFDSETGYPIVKFRNGITKLMKPHSWDSELYPNVSVLQVPLILAWAITIHKAQGASIELAEIDVGNSVFACGQTYVALSRVVSLDGLYLTNFNYKKIKVSSKVKKFYSNL